MAKRLNIHVLIDLLWTPQAGGHVKCWERLAQAALSREDIDLTLHVAGDAPREVALSNSVRFVVHKPVLSTASIPFIGHVPDHTDLASFHPELFKALQGADIIHTTDAYFAYAKTAEKFCAQNKIPLTHSNHTDTVSYTELFTRSMLEKKFGAFGNWLNKIFKIPERAADDMRRKLTRHEEMAKAVFVSRIEDRAFALQHKNADEVHDYHLGLDFDVFSPAATNKNVLRERYKVPENAMVLAFAGRLDEGKNIYTLIDALKILRDRGEEVFLIAAGIGPAEKTIHEKLAGCAATAGFLSAPQLAELYASADWLALPSQVETWSMAGAEALACGLPIIAAAESGVGRFIHAHGAGLMVKENSPQGWAEAISAANRLRKDVTLRARARAAAENNFMGWDAALDVFVKVWKKVSGFRGFEVSKQNALTPQLRNSATPFGQRILILIPHPDDEVVGCAAAIARAKASGARVSALYLGHGCLAQKTMWLWEQHLYETRVARRIEEAGRVADFLGLEVVGQNMQRAAREIWPNLQEVEVEVRAAIKNYAPDCIWVPAYEGGNPDHDALNALASTIATIPVYEFSEYHFARQKIHANAFVEKSSADIVLRLSEDEQKIKRAALELYESERGNLSAMQARQESFRPLPRHDYAKPPHAGKLWYERFQWVPFKHPRVDYTKSSEVCAAIGKFLESHKGSSSLRGAS